MSQTASSVTEQSGTLEVGEVRVDGRTLRAGDHLVCTRFLFGNTNSLMQTLQALGVAVSFVDATEADNVRAAITPATRRRSASDCSPNASPGSVAISHSSSSSRATSV